MRRDPQPTPFADAGYALTELLMSLSILALLLALVPSTLRLGKRAWETPGQIADVPGAAALAFTGDALKSVQPVYRRDSIGMTRLEFSGTESRVSFIAELAAGPSGGGLYRIDAGLLPDRPSLAVAITLYRPESDDGARTPELRDLATSYASVQFRYFGQPSARAKPEWLAVWPRTDRLPDLIDIVAIPRPGLALPKFERRTEMKLRPLL